jgi:hypothetical protein
MIERRVYVMCGCEFFVYPVSQVSLLRKERLVCPERKNVEKIFQRLVSFGQCCARSDCGLFHVSMPVPSCVLISMYFSSHDHHSFLHDCMSSQVAVKRGVGSDGFGILM